MIKVYEIISTHESKIASFLQGWIKVLLICAVVGIIAQIAQQVLTRFVESDNRLKDAFEILRDTMKVIVAASIFVAFGMTFSGLLVPSSTKDKVQLLNKDQYSLQIVDGKLIQLKKDDRKLKLTVQKNRYSKESEADALEIVAETSEHYLCKANTSDRDTYVKVIKNEHNFVKESE